jgi:hypothetical protein
MTSEPRLTLDDAAIQGAVAELERLILARYPEASFSVAVGEDPEGIHLTATVDTDDLTGVLEAVDEHLLELHLERGLPLYVVPVRPPERALRELRQRLGPSPAAPKPMDQPVHTQPGPG